MKNRFVYILFVALLITSLIAACAPQTPAGGVEATQSEGLDEGATGEQAPSDAQDRAVNLRFWVHQNATFEQAYQKLIDDYMAANPDVAITMETFEYETYIQTLQTALPAGEEADILQMFGTWTCRYADQLAPVPGDVMTIDQASGIFYSAPLGGFICDDTLYGLPQEYNIEYGGVLVNKTMFEAAGLTYPPEWQTMDDVIADAQKLTKVDDTGTMTVAGFNYTAGDPMPFAFLAGIMQRGGHYWDEEANAFTFNTPEAVETLQQLKSWQEAGVVDPVLYNNETNWVGESFFTGLVGIGDIGPWAVSLGENDFPDFADEYDYFVLPPMFGDEHHFAADSGWGLTVSPNSANQEAAWDFIKFVTTNADNALGWNTTSSTIPALVEAAENPALLETLPWLERELELLPNGEYLGAIPDRDLLIYNILYTHILNVLQDVETVDDAIQMIQDEANSTIVQ